MYVHTTIIRVKPENVTKTVEVISSAKQQEYFASIGGIRHGFLLEANDEPGKLISLTFWRSPADMLVVLSDPTYAMLIGELRSYLISAPEYVGYNMLAELPFDIPVLTYR